MAVTQTQQLPAPFLQDVTKDLDVSLTGFTEKELDKIFMNNAPEFAEPSNPFDSEINEATADIPASSVRMVQLFLNTDSEQSFRKNIELLKVHFIKICDFALNVI